MSIFHPYYLIEKLLFKSIRLYSESRSGNTIDLGCGDWRISKILCQDKHENLIGIDNWLGSKSHLKKPGLARFYYGSITHVPFPDDCFHTAICTEVLEHTPKPMDVLKEAFRVLKPGGKLIVSVPFILLTHGAPNDYYRFTSFGLLKQLNLAGFHLVGYTPIGDLALTICGTVASVSGFRMLNKTAGICDYLMGGLAALVGNQRANKFNPKIYEEPRPSEEDRNIYIGFIALAKKPGPNAGMKDDVLDEVAPGCPVCKISLSGINDNLHCSVCGMRFYLHNGVPVLAIKEELNLYDPVLGKNLVFPPCIGQ